MYRSYFMTGLKIEENPFAQQMGVEKWQRKELVVPKPEEYLIADIIPANSLVSLQTSGVYGKTTLAMQMALGIAFDTPFLDSFSCRQPGKVLFLNARETDGDNHRRFKRLVRELSNGVPDINDRIDAESKNFTFISMYDDCYGISPHLVDVSGAMTRTYSYLKQFSEYFKTKFIVLDPVEDFFPENLGNVTELYLKLRQLKSTVLLVVGDRERYGYFHEVEVAMYLSEGCLRLQSAYTGHREIPVEMGAGIWSRR